MAKSGFSSPKPCKCCTKKDDNKWIRQMIGWGKSFSGYYFAVAWCKRCRGMNKGHWRYATRAEVESGEKN